MATWSNTTFPDLPRKERTRPDQPDAVWGWDWTTCPSFAICMTQGHKENCTWVPSSHLVPWLLLSLLRLQFTTRSWNASFPTCTTEEGCDRSHCPGRKREKPGRVDIKTSLDLAVCSTSLLCHGLKTRFVWFPLHKKGQALHNALPRSGTNTCCRLPSSKWVKVSSLKLPGSVNCLIPLVTPVGLTPTYPNFCCKINPAALLFLFF